MTLTLSTPSFGRSCSRLEGFTLIEMLVSAGLMSLVLMALLGTHLIGLQIFSLTAGKLTANQSAKAILNPLRNDIRTSQGLIVGTGNAGGFTNLPANALRQGNALQVYPSSTTNVFVRYYVDPAAQTLNRMTSGGAVQVLADHLTNQMPFCAESFTGAIMTNDVNARLVDLTMQFRQWALPGTPGVSGATYDYYQIHTRITRRKL